MTASHYRRVDVRPPRPTRREEEYRRRVFGRLGLPDVAAIAAALRQIPPCAGSSSPTKAA